MNCLPCLRGKNSEEKKSDDQQKDDKKESEEEELPQELPVAQPKENPLSKQPSVKNGASLKNVKSVKKTKSVVTTADLKKKDEDSDDEGDGGSDTAAPALAPVAVSNAATATTNIATTTTDEPPTGSARTFKFRDLASATKNFKRECLLGESGFGRVYKGTLDDGKVVAVKQLDKIGTKANKEFIEEVMKLSDLHHPNLVELIGYCADGDQRLLVYEHMPRGSVKDHLHDLPSGKKPLDWITRMKAAAGAAQAMEYLHEKVKPPVLCRNVKSTNILLDENFEPKVTDYGLVNLESSSGSSVQQRVVGTVGCAPEYEYTGELTLKSDVYSFGVILLELITGRKAMDTSRPKDEQNLVSWAQPYFKDPKRFQELADPMFKGVIPEKNLNQAVGVAAMCLQEESGVRPLISDIVGALNFLTIAPSEGFTPSPAPAEPISGPPKQYSSLSSSSSSSESDSDRELGIHIEPFNRPVMPEPMDEPKPKPESDSESESEPEPEPEVEWEQKHEWESESETEPEPEPQPEPEPEPDFTDSDSDSDSDSDQEPVSKPEPVIQPVYKLEPVVEPQELSSHNDQPDSDNDSISSSGSIYEEDAYSEEEFSDEEKPSTSILINSKSKARMRVKSSKKRVMFKTEGTDSIKPVKKSFTKSRDDQKSPRYKKPPLHSNTKNMRKPDSRGDDNSDIEFTDESESDEEFGTQRFKSTISRFTAESRTYSAYQDENDHDSSSESDE